MTPPALWPSMNTGRPRSRDLASATDADVIDVVGELLDVEALAVGLAAAAKIERVDRKPAGGQLLGDPGVVAAVGVEAGHDHDDARACVGGRHDRKKILRPL